MISGMGNASGSSMKYALAALHSVRVTPYFYFAQFFKGKTVYSISRLGREDLSLLCSETRCSFAAGGICVKCADLFKYRGRGDSFGIWMVLTLQFGGQLTGQCVKENQAFLKVGLGKRLGRQISLGCKVFCIIKARLSQGSLSFAWRKMSFLNNLTNFFFGILLQLVHFQVPERM